MAADSAPMWRDRGGSLPERSLTARTFPWRGRPRNTPQEQGANSSYHQSWDTFWESVPRSRDPSYDASWNNVWAEEDAWSSWARGTYSSDNTNPWEAWNDGSWDRFPVEPPDTRQNAYMASRSHDDPTPTPTPHSQDPGRIGPFPRAARGTNHGSIGPRHDHQDVPPPAATSARYVFTNESSRQDMSQSQSSLETPWLTSFHALTEEPRVVPPRAPAPSIPPPRQPYFEMSQVRFHRADSFGNGRDRESFSPGPSHGPAPIPPGLVFPTGGVGLSGLGGIGGIGGLGVGVAVWDIGSVTSLSASRSLARGVIDAHTALYTFKQKDVRGEACDSASKKCCICLEDFVEGQQLRILPCFHRYHQGCIDEWLGRSDECPLCKFRITTDDAHFIDAVEVSSHGSATPRLATIESGSEETDSVQDETRAWSQAVGVNNHDNWPSLRDERQAASSLSLTSSVERTWDRFDGLNTQVSNLTAAFPLHEPPRAHE
ncbi:RNF43, partial [Symbiodinium pilosum]